MAFRTRIVRIGNSQGIRIPKAILEDSGLSSEVEIEVSDGTIVIRPTTNPRAGWAEALDADPMQDAPLIPDDLPGQFDQEDWTWE
ncbi:MAG: antitoxin MazE [Rhodothermales bacterium]|jgi:antitoxin MazE